MGLVLETCNAHAAALHICMLSYNNAAHVEYRLKCSIGRVCSNLEYKEFQLHYSL
jgi:hypothetical protein